MRLIFATDAIFPPLTGIGRYALELALRLADDSRVADLRFLGMFGWAPPPKESMGSEGPPHPGVREAAFAHLRRTMATRPWAVDCYDAVSERLRPWLLRSARGAVLHSPNYFLPRHDGPSVATVHDLSNYRFSELHPEARRRYVSLAFERSLGRATMLITDTEAVRQELIADFSVAPERVRAVHLGVDPSFRPRRPEALQPALTRHGLQAGAYLLAVATLEPRKKLDHLIAAHARLPAPLRRAYPLVLAGAQGWLNAAAQAAIARSEAEGTLRYLGYVPQAELPLLYAGARGFAMISIYEGFGLPVAEAMASGVPVLTSDCSCLPEVAGGAALLVDPMDVPAVTANLERLLTDEPWRAQAVGRGLARAAALTWERCVSATVDVYAEAAGEATAAPAPHA